MLTALALCLALVGADKPAEFVRPPAGVVIPPATPGDQPIEITLPYNPDACTKADLAKIAKRLTALESRVRPCECELPATKPVLSNYLPPALKPKAASVAKPTVYHLKDATGQVWSHTEPKWLATYVRQVNAARAQRYFYPAQTYGSACAGGQCGR